MSPSKSFDDYKKDAFAKYGIDTSPKPSPTPQKPSDPPPLVLPVDKTTLMPDMGGLEATERTIPPENGVWKKPLRSGKYFMITYVNGEKHGLVTQWSDKDICLMEAHFNHNILHGPCRIFDSYGRITMALTYVNGAINGYLVAYQQSGVVSYESWYVDNVQEGLMRCYNPFGDVAQETMYKNGQRHGRSVTYFPKNQGPCQIVYFENGLQTGDEQTFYPNGVLMQSVPYQAGCAESYPQPLDPQGKPIISPIGPTNPLPRQADPLMPSAHWEAPGAKPFVDTKPRLSHPDPTKLSEVT